MWVIGKEGGEGLMGNMKGEQWMVMGNWKGKRDEGLMGNWKGEELKG